MYLRWEQGQFKSMQWQQTPNEVCLWTHKINVFVLTHNFSFFFANTSLCAHRNVCTSASKPMLRGWVSWRDPWLNVPLITSDPLFHLPYLVIWVVYSEVAHTNDDFVQQSFTGMLGAVPQQGADNVPEGQGQSFSSHNRLKNRPRNKN